MKIKLDFITNSSTTSFIVWGIESEIYKLEEKKSFLKKFCEYIGYEDEENLYLHNDNFHYRLEKFLKEFGLESYIYYDNIFIGVPPSELLYHPEKYNYSLFEFLQSIINKLAAIGINIQKDDIKEILYCEYKG